MVAFNSGDLVQCIQAVTAQGVWKVRIESGCEGKVHSVGAHSACIEFRYHRFPRRSDLRTMLLQLRLTDVDKFVVQTGEARKSENHRMPLVIQHKFVKKRFPKEFDLEMHRVFGKERLRRIMAWRNAFLHVQPWIDSQLSLRHGRSKVTTPKSKR